MATNAQIITNEYGATMTLDEFNAKVLRSCVYHFWDSVGTNFS